MPNSLQSFLDRQNGVYRSQTTVQTDERVRVANEAIAGALALKMLAWEDLFLNRIREVRLAEQVCQAQGCSEGFWMCDNV